MEFKLFQKLGRRPLPLLGAALLASIFFADEAEARFQGHRDWIIISNSEELQGVMIPENAGRRIHVRAGEYEINQTLMVPDGAILQGEGTMLYDESGLPTGLQETGRTNIKSGVGLVGDMMVLGHGSVVRGLRLEGAPRPPPTRGNIMVVSSRAEDDFVSASIYSCELVNPNGSGIALDGPSGRGLLVISRNLGQELGDPPHEGSRVVARMENSIIRSPGGGSGLFAINFAGRSQVAVMLSNNTIGGGIDANGGVSRPDAVTNSSTTIVSHRNLYRSDITPSQFLGWSITGGSGPPISFLNRNPPLVTPPTSSNTFRILSFYDRIENFVVGIWAIGGRRFFPDAVAGPSFNNLLDLVMVGTQISSDRDDQLADLWLIGARSEEDFTPGDGNRSRALLVGVRGTDAEANDYRDTGFGFPFQELSDPGESNCLHLLGSPRSFSRLNEGIGDPLKEFFTGC